ncbi:MFS transporter [Streptomyces glaucus]|uniref:MFS transporter n=1 Tax=Streptomyces glaucus TaxID=284029 RepID=A0ABP5XBI6_9ACTN
MFVLTSATFAIGTDGFLIAGILPDIARSLDVSPSVAGQLVTFFALAYALLSPVLAAVTASWPRRRLLLTGLAVFTLGNVIVAVAPAYGIALTGRLVAAAGAAVVTPVATVAATALVPPQQRGRALAVVIAGLSAATALGAPLGTAIADAGHWRLSLWGVAALGVVAAAGIAVLLPPVPEPPTVGLRTRLAPLRDLRIATVLSTTLLAMTGLYTVYTYISLSFDRATDGSGTRLALLLVVFGLAATIGNLTAGNLTDRFGTRRVLTVALLACVADFALMPWSGSGLPGALVAVTVWGVCGFGVLVPQQHRLISVSGAGAPLSVALNATATYLGVGLSGAIGAAGLHLVGAHRLGLISVVFLALGLGTAELAHRIIRLREQGATPAGGAVPVLDSLSGKEG